MITQNETICAIVTPQGIGGISVIRLSGRDAISITSGLFRKKSGKPLITAKSHTIHYGYLIDPAAGEKLDEVLVSLLRSPHSFTCEDVVEISCHGGPFITGKILDAFIREGARLAEPGEFTKRAFLNGRIDLAQAEAVIDVIRAKTEEGLRCALWQLEGRLSNEINMLHDNITAAISTIEAYIDFPEEDIGVTIDDITGRVQSAIENIDRLIEGYYKWRPFREGVLTAIVGRTNVGKSSLLNTLLGEERAIVTPFPGTTRDIVDGMVSIHGLPLRILDTAGLRSTKDFAEEEGIKRMYKSIDVAELILLVLDGSEPLTPEDKELLERTSGKKRILVINKIDKGHENVAVGCAPPTKKAGDGGQCPPYTGYSDEPSCPTVTQRDTKIPLPFKGRDRACPELVSGVGMGLFSDEAIAYTSTITGGGIEALKKMIRETIAGGDKRLEGEAVITNLRQKVALELAKKELNNFLDAVTRKLPIEIQSLHLRSGIDALAGITGTVTTEDILDRIFSEFCIGK